jgi:nucleotide-binding universal stress UspA family protein
MARLQTVFTRLLIPLDGSKTAEQVMPWALIFANRFKLPVELLAVVDTGTMLTSVDRARHFDELVEQGSRDSKAYLERISGRFIGIKVRRSVESGNAADLIIKKAGANKSNLIAMTTHGHSGLNRWLLGSVAEKVLRATTNPMLLVRASHAGQAEGEAGFKSIIVPLDGSELAGAALPTAGRIAKKLDLELYLMRIVENPYAAFVSGGGPYAVNVDELMKDIRSRARKYLEAKMAELKKTGVEQISYLLQEGIATDEIVSIADQTSGSLIVMSSHGRSGMKRWLLGSVAETVVRHANNPVLVVRPTISAA